MEAEVVVKAWPDRIETICEGFVGDSCVSVTEHLMSSKGVKVLEHEKFNDAYLKPRQEEQFIDAAIKEEEGDL